MLLLNKKRLCCLTNAVVRVPEHCRISASFSSHHGLFAVRSAIVISRVALRSEAVAQRRRNAKCIENLLAKGSTPSENHKCRSQTTCLDCGEKGTCSGRTERD